MITTSDISEVIYDACRHYGVSIYIADTFPDEEIDEERIVIIAKQISTEGKYWNRCYVEVNWCVPDIEDEADGIRLKEVERLMRDIAQGNGSLDGTTYRYSVKSTQVVGDRRLRIHYANSQILFESLKTLEQWNIQQ